MHTESADTVGTAAVVADCAGDLLCHLDRIATAEPDPATAAALDVAWRHVVTACAVLATAEGPRSGLPRSVPSRDRNRPPVTDT